jgi:hypothetical protein
MYDYIKSLNLTDELKNNEIYNIFKTDSSKLNLHFLSSLQKFHTTQEFLNYYTKQDCKKVFNMYNTLSSISSTICTENEKTNFKKDIDKYLSDLSKIILLFSLIQKNNELLSNLIKNTRKFIKRFYIENETKSVIKERINNCINDLMSCSQVASQRNYSRRSTKENTVSNPNIFLGNSLKKSYNNANEEEYLFFQSHTPKFEEEEDEIIEENEEQSFYNMNVEMKEDNSKKDSLKTIGSSLSLKHMKFIYQSDEEENGRSIKKNKTVKLGTDYLKSHSFFKKKSNSYNNKEDIDNENKKNYIKDNSKYIVDFLNSINILYKTGKINSNQKLALKQLIISDSKSMVEKYLKMNLSRNSLDKNYKSNIDRFLLEQIKNLYVY